MLAEVLEQLLDSRRREGAIVTARSTLEADEDAIAGDLAGSSRSTYFWSRRESRGMGTSRSPVLPRSWDAHTGEDHAATLRWSVIYLSSHVLQFAVAVAYCGRPVGR